MNKEPAINKTGFLIFDVSLKRHVFRIYESEDKQKFTDYDICAEDVYIQILDNNIELHKDDSGESYLDWKKF